MAETGRYARRLSLQAPSSLTSGIYLHPGISAYLGGADGQLVLLLKCKTCSFLMETRGILQVELSGNEERRPSFLRKTVSTAIRGNEALQGGS